MQPWQENIIFQDNTRQRYQIKIYIKVIVETIESMNQIVNLLSEIEL